VRLIRLLKKDLAREAVGWLDKGIIDELQARAICAEYGVDFDRAADYSGGYRLLVNLAWLFMGLAVITIIGGNWEQIPRAIRFGGLLLATGTCHLIAINLYRKGRDGASSGIFLLANILYGASIVLIAQMYHLGEHMPDGIFWWALGSLPAGLLTGSPMLMLFSCVLALIWFWVESQMGYFPLLFPMFILAGLWVLYSSRSSLLLLLTVAGSFGLWTEALITDYSSRYIDIEAEHFIVAGALAIFFYALASWLMTIKTVKATDYGMVLSIWALRLGLLLLFIVSFSDPWRDLIRADWPLLNETLVVAGLLMLATLYFAWRAGRLKLFVPVVLIACLALPLVVNLAEPKHAIYLQVAVNIVLIAVGALLIVRGTSTGTSHYFFMGVVTILLTALLRYIDLVGNYLGGAVLFAVMAAVLLAAARYWRGQVGGTATTEGV